jgi:two-component system sensor kinase FixL
LGIVINSSNNIREILGYDKADIIGKNVTKLMPKIYSELHNIFMLKFIRSESSHLRPSDKIVTALNKDSLLVIMKLSVRMMIDSQNALVVVGFINKCIS